MKRTDPAVTDARRARRAARRDASASPEDEVREIRRLAREARPKPTQRGRAKPARDDSVERRYFRRMVAARGCVMCDAYPVDKQTRLDRYLDLVIVQAHHIVPQRALKRWGLHARLWDVRNGLALCRYHHGQHEAAKQRVPRHLLPAAAFEFADEIGARSVLEDDRVYPVAA